MYVSIASNFFFDKNIRNKTLKQFFLLNNSKTLKGKFENESLIYWFIFDFYNNNQIFYP